MARGVFFKTVSEVQKVLLLSLGFRWAKSSLWADSPLSAASLISFGLGVLAVLVHLGMECIRDYNRS